MHNGCMTKGIIPGGAVATANAWDFDRWLHSNCLITDEIDSSRRERYKRFKTKAGNLRTGDTAAFARMLRI
jgi:hypothetical protein